MEMGAKGRGVRRYRFKSLMNWAQTHSYLQINPQRRSKREAPPSPGDGGGEKNQCCFSFWCSSLDVPPHETNPGAGGGSPRKGGGPRGSFVLWENPGRVDRGLQRPSAIQRGVLPMASTIPSLACIL